MSAWFVLPLVAALAACVLGLRRGGRAARLDRRLGALRGLALPTRRSWSERLRRHEGLLLGGAKDRQEIAVYLRAAGVYRQDAPAVFALARAACSVAVILGAQLAVIWTGTDEVRWRLAPVAAGALAFLASKRALGVLASARLRRIKTEMPFMLDLMLLMLEAGGSLDQSFRALARSEGQALPESCRAMRMLVDDIQKGSPYDVALVKWGDRLGVPGAAELAGLFRQSLSHGTEIADALRAFAREFADQRLSRARESVGRKAAQLSAVMMIFFMPVLFILIGGPPAVQVFAALSGLNK